jgi:putative transposase
MSKKSRGGLSSWAQLRFSIIGGLLAKPPKRGNLLRELEILAGHSYQHPTRDIQVTFGVSTLERWYYRALESNDPVQALKRKIRSDAGTTRVMSPELMNALAKQYKNYSSWSYRLHADNVAALVKERPELGDAPSYSTVKRRMKERGWYKKSSRGRKTKGQKQALERLEQREVRSYESSHVHALWHLDFHQGRLRIIDAG